MRTAAPLAARAASSTASSGCSPPTAVWRLQRALLVTLPRGDPPPGAVVRAALSKNGADGRSLSLQILRPLSHPGDQMLKAPAFFGARPGVRIKGRRTSEIHPWEVLGSTS